MYHKDGTLMRGLPMDFPMDENVNNIGTQYMFGPAFLVNPVTEFKARARDVYLPAGTKWFDFYSGKPFDGSQTISASAPLSRMPLFVKAGSIVPTGPAIQYADQSLNAPITLFVYTGADGSFELYEDDGRSYAYEQGGWSRIPISYNDADGTLVIGDRVGTFEGMAETRTINLRWISGETKHAADFDAKADQSVVYNGKSITIKKANTNTSQL
jgi:alpha-D-xyloside xylohydrolase